MTGQGRRPPIFATTPGRGFALAFAEGFWRRHGGLPPEACARIQIFVNTPRALREIERALAEAAPGSALLPRLILIQAIGADPLLLPQLPPAISAMRRHLRLMRLVEAYAQAAPGGRVPVTAAADLTDTLTALLDEFDEEGISAGGLDDAVEAPYAAHWQDSLKFVDLVRRHWPAIRQELEGGAPDAKARQRAAVTTLAEGWAAAPPAHPVIAAGTTGAVATTSLLLEAIAALPTGLIVLPGLDRSMPDDIWTQIAGGAAPEHPQAPFSRLLIWLQAAPSQAGPWDDAAPSPRHRLFAEALRPAPVTDAWRKAAAEIAPAIGDATGKLSLVEAETPRHEAAAIALAIRRALEDSTAQVALITPDGGLARRVTAELDRFGIVPDDSLGRPLAESPPGVFLRLIADLAAGGAAPVATAAFLQHPLCQPGLARGRHRTLARTYEIDVLRQRGAAAPDRGRLPPWPEGPEGCADWLAGIETALAGLTHALGSGASLAETVAAHGMAAEALSTSEPGALPAIWDGPAGAEARAALTALAAAADAHGAEAVRAYPALFLHLLRGHEIRPAPVAPHPRVTILGPREARTHPADVVILAGLNDGVWPALPAEEPWLNRPIRQALGLQPPEQQIGLSAHDFQNAALRREVILTRALKVDGTPTVPSRWLLRLQSLLGGIGEGVALAAMRARGKDILRLIGHTHLPPPAMVLPLAPRPAPNPPLETRPRRLSVTEIETLVRDPYAIYAKKVLGLKPLDPLGRPPDYADRGTLIHAVLERFVRDTKAGLPDAEAAAAALLAAADTVLHDTLPWPDLRRIWKARIARAAGWFLTGERARRQAGQPEGFEVKGEMTLAAPGGPFTLRARADRIDLLSGGGAAVFDYKTGTPPTPKQIASGFSQQLHLQAAILAAGGFDGLPKLTAETGAYLTITGSGDGGKETPAPDLATEVAEHMQKLRDLLASYDAGRPYVSRERVERSDQTLDYDHLARRPEWDSAGTGDGE